MRGSSWDSEGRALAASDPVHHSVVAGVRPAVSRVIRATKAVVAANEITSSIAKVVSAHASHVTSDVTSSETSDASSAEAADVASAEAADVTSAEAAHVTSAATTSMSSATATAGLCISGKKAAGKHCAC
jgi:geranylgeranyl pyrophosphate synthase